MKLVITQTHSTAQYIADYLGANIKMDGYFEGNDYCVSWVESHLLTIGQARDYGYEKWSDIPLPFLPEFKLLPIQDKGLKALLGINKSLMNKAQIIINASDPSSEGELIFRNLYEYSGSKCPVKRLWLSSLTNEAIDNAFRTLNDSSQYNNLFLSAKARNQADWIVGINSTTILTLKSGIVYLLGRLQTPVLKIIVDRTKQNREFKTSTYHQLSLEIEGGFNALNTVKHQDEPDIKEYLERFNLQLEEKCLVLKAEFSKSIQPPDSLYSLSTLQIDANKKFGFSAEQTLNIAQILYINKFISYPITDSQYLSKDMFNMVSNLFSRFKSIRNDIIYKSENLSIKNTRLFDDSNVKNNHAIIPTYKSFSSLNDDEIKLYGLILVRFLSCFAQDAIIQSAKYTLLNKNTQYELNCNYYYEHGWKLFYSTSENYKSPFIDLNEGSILSCVPSVVTYETTPEPIFTDATLIMSMNNSEKDLDDEMQIQTIKGIKLGSSANQTSIIEKLIKSEYIKRKGESIFSTIKGEKLISLLDQNNITSWKLAALWEQNISKIQDGSMSFDFFMNGFKDYSLAMFEELQKISPTLKTTNMRENLGVCPKCKTGNIYQGKKAYYCNNFTNKLISCSFSINKTISNKKITENMVKQLLVKKSTDKLKFKDENNRQYEANIILKEDDFVAVLMVTI